MPIESAHYKCCRVLQVSSLIIQGTPVRPVPQESRRDHFRSVRGVVLRTLSSAIINAPGTISASNSWRSFTAQTDVENLSVESAYTFLQVLLLSSCNPIRIHRNKFEHQWWPAPDQLTTVGTVIPTFVMRGFNCLLFKSITLSCYRAEKIHQYRHYHCWWHVM